MFFLKIFLNTNNLEINNSDNNYKVNNTNMFPRAKIAEN